MLSPNQTFEDNFRPAQLLLQVYRLLDANDQLQTTGGLVDALREVVDAQEQEELMVLANDLFGGKE